MQVRPAHVKALSELLEAIERQRRICKEGEGFEEFSRSYGLDHLHFLGLKNDWPFAELIALLCKKTQKTAEEYKAVLASLSSHRSLRDLAQTLPANCTASLVAAQAEFKASDRMMAKLPLQHLVDAIEIPMLDNGFTRDEAAAIGGQLQGITELLDGRLQALRDSLRLPGLTEE